MIRSRLVLTIAALLASASVTAAGSAAADNTKISGSYSFTAHHICTDPIRVVGSYDEMLHTFYDTSGSAVRLSFTGKNLITYTNLTTGATYSPNSSGPGTIDLRSGQSVIRGGNGFLFDSNGILVATDGRVVLDADGNVISATGHVVGVCEHLGSTPA